MRRRRLQQGGFPSNDLERVMQIAAETGDDAKLRRALAHGVVCIAQPADGLAAPAAGAGPAFLRVDVSRRPVPVGQTADGRQVVLAFTSQLTLFAFYTDDPRHQVWVQTRAGDLFDTLPENMPVALNAAGPLSVELPPDAVRDVADLALGRNVISAYQPGPATTLRMGEPTHEPMDVLAAVSRAAARHPRVLAAHRGLLTLDEPDARVWPVIGVRVVDGTDRVEVERVMTDVLHEVSLVTEEFVQLVRLPGDPPSEVQRRLAATDPFYSVTEGPG